MGSSQLRLRVVVHGFGGSVVEGHIEPGKHAVLVATQHPGEVAQRLEATVGGPPEPLPHVALGPPARGVAPEAPERLLQQVGAIDLQFDPFEEAQMLPLAVGQVPWVLQPDVASALYAVLEPVADRPTNPATRAGCEPAPLPLNLDRQPPSVPLHAHDAMVLEPECLPHGLFREHRALQALPVASITSTGSSHKGPCSSTFIPAPGCTDS